MPKHRSFLFLHRVVRLSIFGAGKNVIFFLQSWIIFIFVCDAALCRADVTRRECSTNDKFGAKYMTNGVAVRIYRIRK